MPYVKHLEEEIYSQSSHQQQMADNFSQYQKRD
jgi:hypothetical protein